VASEEDRHHEVGTLYYFDLLDEGAHLLTSDYVLDETITRLRYFIPLISFDQTFLS
jgi:hypothetical protein